MDVINSLESASIVEKTSKAGKPYYMLSLRFNTGYVYETFLNNEQYFILSGLLEND